jgi:hypothetical protein
MEPLRRAAAADFPAELQLLVACGGQPDERSNAEIEQLLRGKLDWQAVVAHAMWHGLAPLVAARLEPFPALVPPQIRQRFRALHAQALQHNLKLMGYSREALNCLAAREIVAVPFKGPLLAQQLYGNLALRQCADIDILIRRKDLTSALDALRELNFAPALPISDHQKQALAAFDFELWLQRDSTHLELHWECIPRFYGIGFGLDQALPRVRRLLVDGAAITELAPEDLFLALTLHGTKHLWAKLIWLLDLVRLAEVHSDFDWRLVLANVRQLRVERLFLVATQLASELFGLAVPEKVQEEWKRRPELNSLVGRAYANLASPEPQVEGLRNYWFFLLVRDTWSDRARQLWLHSTTPGPGEWPNMQRRLPAALYLPMHLLRLARRFAKSAGELAAARLQRARRPRAAAPEAAVRGEP